MLFRPATLSDLEAVASWIGSSQDCELWAGGRVKYPIDLGSLPEAILFERTNAFSLSEGEVLAAFGQLVRKNAERAMLGRIIVCPALRGEGYGERFVGLLLGKARADGLERVGLYVDNANAPAIALYAKTGFRNAALPADQPEWPGARYMEVGIGD